MGNAALQQLLQCFVNKADLRAKNDLAGRGGGADHTGSPGGFECLFIHLSAVFQLEAQPCGAAAGFLHIGLTAQRSQNVGGDAASFFFCSAALLVERATKKQITAATASSTGITIQTLGAAGARATPPAITAAHKIRASTKKAGDRQMRWNEFMLQSTDFNIIKQEKKELNASFCPPKQKSRRQGHGGQPAAWNKGTRTLALAVT